MADSDRAFPLLTGLGVAVALLLAPWIPPFQGILLPAFALFVAVPAGTLRLRNGRALWLGVGHSLAASTAVLLATSLPAIIGNVLLSRATFIWQVPSMVEMPAIVVFVASVSLLSGWFSLLFQRWAERTRVTVPPRRSLSNPMSWGAAGIVGGTTSLVAAAVSTWILVVAVPRFSGVGPLGPWALFVALSVGFIALLGLVGVVLEAAHGRVSHPARRELP